MATMHTTTGFGAETFTTIATHDDLAELSEGYAEVGDMRLHYVEAGTA